MSSFLMAMRCVSPLTRDQSVPVVSRYMAMCGRTVLGGHSTQTWCQVVTVTVYRWPGVTGHTVTGGRDSRDGRKDKESAVLCNTLYFVININVFHLILLYQLWLFSSRLPHFRNTHSLQCLHSSSICLFGINLHPNYYVGTSGRKNPGRQVTKQAFYHKEPTMKDMNEDQYTRTQLRCLLRLSIITLIIIVWVVTSLHGLTNVSEWCICRWSLRI